MGHAVRETEQLHFRFSFCLPPATRSIYPLPSAFSFLPFALFLLPYLLPLADRFVILHPLPFALRWPLH